MPETPNSILSLVASAALATLSCGHQKQGDERPQAKVALSPTPTALVRVAQSSLQQVADDELARQARREPWGRIGTFRMTYYHVASEAEVGGGAKNTTLYTPRCKPIAKVTRKLAREASMEGTARLEDGRTINVARSCSCRYSPCFFVAKEEHAWGVGVGDRPLSPFRSVAVDRRYIPYGTMVYVAELDGLTMPGFPPWGGFVHDGCVVAADTGGGIRGRQIDLFSGNAAAYRALYDRHKIDRVTIYDGKGRCDKPAEAVAGLRNAI